LIYSHSRLPYKGSPRRVIFEGARQHTAENVKNLIVEWQSPPATIKKSKPLLLVFMQNELLKISFKSFDKKSHILVL